VSVKVRIEINADDPEPVRKQEARRGIKALEGMAGLTIDWPEAETQTPPAEVLLATPPATPEPATIQIGTAEAKAGNQVSIVVTGVCNAEITSYNFSVEHPTDRLKFIRAMTPEWLGIYAGSDLMFRDFYDNRKGVATVVALLDPFPPYRVEPVTIGGDRSELATLVYIVLPRVAPGRIPLVKKTAPEGYRWNSFTAKAGGQEVFPTVLPGGVEVAS